jgi:hypothetical protein
MPWIRVIDPEKELQRLNVRNRISSNRMNRQRDYPADGHDTDHEYKGDKRTNYTRMSAFHYVQNGIGQDLFAELTGEKDSSSVAIIINCKRDMSRPVLFRKSANCVVTDEIFKKAFKSPAEYKEALKNYAIEEVTEKEAKEWTENLFKEFSNDDYFKKNPEEIIEISWTEGLFRHTINDISSICINPNSSKSRLVGYCFARTVEKHTGKYFDFFSYNGENGNLTKFDREVITSEINNDEALLEKFQKLYSKYKEILGKVIEAPSAAPNSASSKPLDSQSSQIRK